jgi:hypothetical protein
MADHDPPVATTDWRPGETITYERQQQPESSVLVFKDGWYPPEMSDDREWWRWTSGEASIEFRNPHQESTLYFELDGLRRHLS